MEWFDCSQYSAIRSLVEGSGRLTEVHASASGVAMSIERQYETEAEQYSFNSMAIILPNASKPLLTSYYFNLLPPNGEPIRLCARDIAAQTIHLNDYSQNPYTMVEDSLVVRWATILSCRLNIGHNKKSPITADGLTKSIHKEVAQILGIAPNANDQQATRALKYLYNAPANSNVYKDRERMIGIVKGK